MKIKNEKKKQKQKQNNTDLPHNGYKRTVSKNLETQRIQSTHTYKPW